MNEYDKVGIISWIVGIMILVVLGVGGWYIKRSVNSWLYYDNATTEQVCKMIKPEFIKDGYCN